MRRRRDTAPLELAQSPDERYGHVLASVQAAMFVGLIPAELFRSVRFILRIDLYGHFQIMNQTLSVRFDVREPA